MNIKKEVRFLTDVGKKILDKNNYKQIKKVKDLGEKRDLFEHAIKKELEKKVIEFREEMNVLKEKGEETLFIKVKINLLKLKINYFIVGFKKKDFNLVLKLIKKIKRDLKNA